VRHLISHSHSLPYNLYRWRTYKDNRTWRQRTQRADANWDPLLPTMAAAYLRWKYPLPPTSTSPPHGDPSLDFEIVTVDLYSLDSTAYITRSSDSESPVVDLVLQGFLGNVPLNPSMAVSIKTLELYRRIRMRKPSFSAEAFAKVVCDLYAIPYRRRYRTVLSDTFDIYLALLRIVDKQVQGALGRDTPNWRVLNACPPCTYKVWINFLFHVMSLTMSISSKTNPLRLSAESLHLTETIQ
jgi:hypothetical protein